MWMDILAVLPFFFFRIFQDIKPDDNMFLELAVLLVPILRLLKVTRHSSGWRLLVISLKMCLEPLMVPAFLLLLMVVFCSCLIFWLEKHFASEEDGPAFSSIPHTMWFTIVTVSTVGYGDVSPYSDLGKAASSALILIGVCYMAMPLAIVGETFGQVWRDGDRILIAEKSKAKFSAEGLDKNQLAKLFAAIDEDGSGSLSRKEFVHLIQTFQLGFTVAQIRKLYRSIDDDDTGSVTFQEFCDFLFPEVEIDDDNLNSPRCSKVPPSTKVEPYPGKHELSKDEVIHDPELEAEVQGLEQDVKYLREEVLNGFRNVLTLLGVSAAALTSKPDRSESLSSPPGVTCTTPEPFHERLLVSDL